MISALIDSISYGISKKWSKQVGKHFLSHLLSSSSSSTSSLSILSSLSTTYQSCGGFSLVRLFLCLTQHSLEIQVSSSAAKAATLATLLGSPSSALSLLLPPYLLSTSSSLLPSPSTST